MSSMSDSPGGYKEEKPFVPRMKIPSGSYTQDTDVHSSRCRLFDNNYSYIESPRLDEEAIGIYTSTQTEHQQILTIATDRNYSNGPETQRCLLEYDSVSTVNEDDDSQLQRIEDTFRLLVAEESGSLQDEKTSE